MRRHRHSDVNHAARRVCGIYLKTRRSLSKHWSERQNGTKQSPGQHDADCRMIPLEGATTMDWVTPHFEGQSNDSRAHGAVHTAHFSTLD
jgi:hypothetical protein